MFINREIHRKKCLKRVRVLSAATVSHTGLLNHSCYGSLTFRMLSPGKALSWRDSHALISLPITHLTCLITMSCPITSALPSLWLNPNSLTWQCNMSYAYVVKSKTVISNFEQWPVKTLQMNGWTVNFMAAWLIRTVFGDWMHSYPIGCLDDYVVYWVIR
jgi:hypothetical protein